MQLELEKQRQLVESCVPFDATKEKLVLEAATAVLSTGNDSTLQLTGERADQIGMPATGQTRAGQAQRIVAIHPGTGGSDEDGLFAGLIRILFRRRPRQGEGQRRGGWHVIGGNFEE